MSSLTLRPDSDQTWLSDFYPSLTECTEISPTRGTICPICHVDLDLDLLEQIVVHTDGKCENAFHRDCLAEWLQCGVQLTPSCPMCRVELTSPDILMRHVFKLHREAETQIYTTVKDLSADLGATFDLVDEILLAGRDLVQLTQCQHLLTKVVYATLIDHLTVAEECHTQMLQPHRHMGRDYHAMVVKLRIDIQAYIAGLLTYLQPVSHALSRVRQNMPLLSEIAALQASLPPCAASMPFVNRFLYYRDVEAQVAIINNAISYVLAALREHAAVTLRAVGVPDSDDPDEYASAWVVMLARLR